MSYAVQRPIGRDYLLQRYGLLGLGTSAHGCEPAAPTWDEAKQTCVCDGVLVDGVCRDPSVDCGPGTHWVDADQACVALTKYMSQAQIAAAVRAGVDLTGKGAPPVQQVVRRASPRAVPVSTAASSSKLASMFSGKNAPLILGAVAVGVVGLAFLAHKKTGKAKQ